MVVEPYRNHHSSDKELLGNGITESRTYSNDNLLVHPVLPWVEV